MNTIIELLFTHKPTIEEEKVYHQKGHEKKPKKIQKNIHKKNYKEVLP
ncbi:hypothetical protein IAE16_00670 [Hydrogenobacter sp. T-2]|nr:hypothetical protein [Hydrogenobacter sp. T-2]WPM32210.1 hypothetical protein IAE16_00670 [Hydrogenobacter sp. T-2]